MSSSALVQAFLESLSLKGVFDTALLNEPIYPIINSVQAGASIGRTLANKIVLKILFILL